MRHGGHLPAGARKSCPGEPGVSPAPWPRDALQRWGRWAGTAQQGSVSTCRTQEVPATPTERMGAAAGQVPRWGSVHLLRQWPNLFSEGRDLPIGTALGCTPEIKACPPGGLPSDTCWLDLPLTVSLLCSTGLGAPPGVAVCWPLPSGVVCTHKPYSHCPCWWRSTYKPHLWGAWWERLLWRVLWGLGCFGVTRGQDRLSPPHSPAAQPPQLTLYPLGPQQRLEQPALELEQPGSCAQPQAPEPVRGAGVPAVWRGQGQHGRGGRGRPAQGGGLTLLTHQPAAACRVPGPPRHSGPAAPAASHSAAHQAP